MRGLKLYSFLRFGLVIRSLIWPLTALAVLSYSHLPAVIQDRAHRALRKPSCANVLPEGHEKTVDFHPISARQPLFELATSSFRRWCSHVAPSVRHAMNMNIDADLTRSAGDSKREIRALRSNPAKRSHYVEITGQLTTVFQNDAPGEIANIVRLRLVETRRTDESSNLRYAQPAYCFSRRSCFEQPNCNRQRNFVSRAYGYDAGNQLMKRGGVALGRQIEHGSIGELLYLQPDATQHGVDVERALGSPTIHTHLRSAGARNRPESGCELTTWGARSEFI
jgi:hypothetical protein